MDNDCFHSVSHTTARMHASTTKGPALTCRLGLKPAVWMSLCRWIASMGMRRMGRSILTRRCEMTEGFSGVLTSTRPAKPRSRSNHVYLCGRVGGKREAMRGDERLPTVLEMYRQGTIFECEDHVTQRLCPHPPEPPHTNPPEPSTHKPTRALHRRSRY